VASPLVAESPRLTIRDARPEDWDAIWPFFHEIVAARETYAYDPDMSEAEGRRMWMIGPPGRTVVASDEDDTVLGSFMVDPRQAGRGVGRALGEHVIGWARESGFRAIQFNAVVETNQAAVALWRSLGFEVLTSVPEAFEHPRHGYVGLLIMHRFL